MKSQLGREITTKFMVAILALLVTSFALIGCTTTATTNDDIVNRDKKPEQQIIQDDGALAIADGRYTAEVNYPTPGGDDLIEVMVEVQSDIVRAVSLTTISGHKVSDKYVKRTNGALPDLIIGKKIDELNLPRQVSGASLTTAAFKKHINKLIEDY